VLVLAEDTGVTWVVQSLASNEGALIVQPIDDVTLKQLVLASDTDHPSAYAWREDARCHETVRD